ncbi:MAG: hypothetical protein AB7P02_26410 [Alphaproteobacteria bacterium]
MLVIGRGQLASLERIIAARAGDDRTERFLRWWQAHPLLPGPADKVALQALEAAHGAEAQGAGIDPADSGSEGEERLFLYLAARRLMPEMTGEQYLLTLDIAFDPDQPMPARVQAIRDLVTRDPAASAR